MTEISRVLNDIERGDPQAASKLFALVYDELRALAAHKLANEKPGQTLQPTALVHEAWLRLMGGEATEAAANSQFSSRGHFFASAAQAMRRILVDKARRKNRVKHGGQFQRVELGEVPTKTPDEALLALDEALNKLTEEDPIASQVVQLRHFSGLGNEQIAEVLGITLYQARQKWTYARAWLHDALGS